MATHLSPEEQAEGFELLFNGKDLNDWKIIGPEEGWEVQNGLMVCNGEGRGWIRPKACTQTLYCAWTIETAREETAESSCGQAKKDAPPIREWKYKFTTYRTTHSTINQTAPSTMQSPPPLIRLIQRENGTPLKYPAREQW